MINFLLACFASLLSFLNFPSYAANFNYLDGSCYLTDSEVVDNHPSNKNVGYIDEYGVQLYLFKSDLLSEAFIIDFVAGFSGVSGGVNYDYSMYSGNLPSPYTFQTDGQFLSALNGYVNRNSVLYNVKNFVLYKDTSSSLNVDGEPFIYVEYRLNFISLNDTSILQIKYGISSPLYDDYQHDLGGAQLIYVDIMNEALSQYSSIWCYSESSLDSNFPIVSYFYNTWDGENYTLSNENYKNGYYTGYQEGYNAGINTLDSASTTANIIFEGIFDIGLLPINVFLTIFNFEVFGINISGIVSGLLTISVVIIIIRTIVGGKND